MQKGVHFRLHWLETKQTLKLALPIMTSQLGQLLLGVVDSLMIGRVGVAPLGASAFVGSVFAFFLVFGFGVCNCVGPLVARAEGAQNKQECQELLKHSLWYSLVWGVFLAGLIHILASFLHLFNQPEEVTVLARDYLLIMGWSLVPAVLFHAFRQFAEGLSKAFVPMLIVLVAVLLNAFLNWVLIFGNLGFDAYGLNGAGWATFITRVFMLIALIGFLFSSAAFREYLPASWNFRANWKLIKSMLNIGLSSGFQTLFEVGAFVAAAVMMGWLGTNALAAHQVALNVVSMTFMVTLGVSFAVGIRVGSAMGRGDIRAARRIGFGGIGIGVFVMAVFGIMIFLARGIVPGWYIANQEVIDLASKLLLFGALFQIFDGAQGVAVGALRGLSDVRVPTLITFFVYWVITLPLVYMLGFHFKGGAEGIWFGLTLGLILAALLLTSRFDASTRQLMHRVPSSVSAA